MDMRSEACIYPVHISTFVFLQFPALKTDKKRSPENGKSTVGKQKENKTPVAKGGPGPAGGASCGARSCPGTSMLQNVPESIDFEWFVLCNIKLGSSSSRNLASQALPSWSRLGGEMGHQARVENG